MAGPTAPERASPGGAAEGPGATSTFIDEIELQPPVTERPSLRRRAIAGSTWMMIEYGSSQVMRLISVVIVTRLLVPDAFGLMVLVTVVLGAIEMFTDIGLGPSVIQNKRGDDPRFLNTAWTLQVLRNLFIFLAACVCAWPAAMFFREPMLLLLIPVASFASVIGGFTSTSIYWLNRHLQLRKMVIMGIISQVLHYATVVVWAYFSPTVWALIAGFYSSYIFYTIGSHFLVAGHRNWFAWDKSAVSEIYRFGRWIFGSTALMYFVMQTDRIIGGRLWDATLLAVYNFAVQFAVLVPIAIKTICQHVAFPVFAEIMRERPEDLHRQVRRGRTVMIAMGLLGMVPLALLGQWVFAILLPEAYQDGGWMLQILAIGAMATLINATYSSVLLAIGKSKYMMLLQATHLFFLLAGSLTGWYLGGIAGYVIGVAAADWLNYPMYAWAARREGLWNARVDLATLAVAILTVGGVAWLHM